VAIKDRMDGTKPVHWLLIQRYLNIVTLFEVTRRRDVSADKRLAADLHSCGNYSIIAFQQGQSVISFQSTQEHSGPDPRTHRTVENR
jgi:hypothetical protein